MCASACTGTIEAGPRGPGETFVPSAGASGAGSGGAAGSSHTEAPQEPPSPATRAARLTHAQYENTLHDLLGVPLAEIRALTEDLRPDPAQAGFLFENDSLSLSVDGSLFSSYQRVAEALAVRVVDDGALRAQLTGGATDAAEVVRRFGLRAHRRPLGEDEVAEYVALHAMGAELDPARAPVIAGLRVVLEAMLLSPSFLYRVERSAEERDGVIPLDGYEIASRLSYALWGTMPDEALFAAAAAGTLSDPSAVASQAERMLQGERAEAMVARFHEQLFEVEKLASIAPADSAYPEVSDELGAYAREEHERFVRDVVFARDGGYFDLLTSNETFVNDELARIYGLTGSFGDAFVPAVLPLGERRGILTQIGFLAANATSTAPDPIHRGVFIARRIACLPLAAPPANIPPLPPAAGRTNRETIEAHTEQPGTVCAMCHAPIINPLGFPFESFDAVGAYRSEDNGQPVDTSANAPIGGSARAEVASAIELAEALAGSPDVHSCYTKHWIEQLHGRAATRADDALRERLSASSARGALTVRALVTAVVSSPAFLARSTEELP